MQTTGNGPQQQAPAQNGVPGGGFVRLSLNVSTQTAAVIRDIAGRKGLSATESIRRAIAIWQFIETETSAGNRIAVIERDGSIRTVVVL